MKRTFTSQAPQYLTIEATVEDFKGAPANANNYLYPPDLQVDLPPHSIIVYIGATVLNKAVAEDGSNPGYTEIGVEVVESDASGTYILGFESVNWASMGHWGAVYGDTAYPGLRTTVRPVCGPWPAELHKGRVALTVGYIIVGKSDQVVG